MDEHDNGVPLLDLVVDRLAGDTKLAEQVVELILAAVLGDDDLQACLNGEPVARPEPQLDGRPTSTPAMYLAGVRVEGVRGVANAAELQLTPGPGLTLVVGRNGSGKSTFAEAAELALTETSLRWKGRRSKTWEKGWANLHHDGKRAVEVRFHVDGQPGQTLVRRSWNAGDDLADGVTVAQRHGDRQAQLDEVLGHSITTDLTTYRPFLSYNELGALLDDGPSKLHDALSKVLGLDLLVEAEQRLKDAGHELDKLVKEAEGEATRLLDVVQDVDDSRAAECAKALRGDKRRRASGDVAALESVVTGATVPAGSEIDSLEQLRAVHGPNAEAAEGAVASLRGAADRLDALAGTDAQRARQRADLLEGALDAHKHEGGRTCPVCGTAGVLDEAWHQAASVEVERLREDAASVDQAEHAAKRARHEALGLTTPEVPRALTLAETISGVNCTSARAAWAGWRALPEGGDGDLRELAEHLEHHFKMLDDALGRLRLAATEELERRRDLWAPISTQLAAWIPSGRKAQRAARQARQAKTAMDWLRTLMDELRQQRFSPISRQVRELWGRLRQTSNVSIDDVRLTGRGGQRRVNLSVSVDDTEGAALAVMSQGELHAMALSLFLPRARLPQSPFRFIVIDDPVQAMDGARVDGLATVLAEVAKTHQVIVLTHDERLPEATRRLGIEATVLQVTRTPRSHVAIRPQAHPVDQHLADARSVAGRIGTYPQRARRRVVPGLCRQAVEAACIEVTRRRRLAAGQSHADVEDLIRSTPKLRERLALALFDDERRMGDIHHQVTRAYGAQLAETIQALNQGTHQVIDDHPQVLIERTEQLTRHIMELR